MNREWTLGSRHLPPLARCKKRRSKQPVLSTFSRRKKKESEENRSFWVAGLLRFNKNPGIDPINIALCGNVLFCVCLFRQLPTTTHVCPCWEWGGSPEADGATRHATFHTHASGGKWFDFGILGLYSSATSSRKRFYEGIQGNLSSGRSFLYLNKSI